MENTETLIVEQLKAGNENAYRYLYDHHYALLCHVANGYLKDQFLSETIVGDTIFHLWEIAFSALMPDEMTDDKIILSDSYPLGTLLERELENEIYKAIDKLPDECRRVFAKSRFEGKSYEEISRELGISVNTVKYHIKNALASLHVDLSKYLLSLLLLFFR